MVHDEAARQANEMGAPLDSEDRACRPDALAQQMQDSAGAATNVNDTFTRLNPDPIELCLGIGGKIGDLALEACLFSLAATEQIMVRLGHGVLLFWKAVHKVYRGYPCSL
jgi:hypothetical protein